MHTKTNTIATLYLYEIEIKYYNKQEKQKHSLPKQTKYERMDFSIDIKWQRLHLLKWFAKYLQMIQNIFPRFFHICFRFVCFAFCVEMKR